MPRAGSLTRPAVLLAIGSLVIPTACVPPSDRDVRAIGSGELEQLAYSPIPPGIKQLKADMMAATRAEEEAAPKPPPLPVDPYKYDPARAPEVAAAWQDADRTTFSLEVTRPRFLNLDPSTVAGKAGSLAPPKLAATYAAYLAKELAVCVGADCTDVRSVELGEVTVAGTETPAESIGDDPYVTSSRIRYTQPVDGSCTISPSASRSGRVKYLSPRVRMAFTVTLTEGADEGAKVQVPFPGGTDSFAGVEAGMAVFEAADDSTGDLVCRGAWSGAERPRELELMMTADIAAPAEVEVPEATTATVAVAETEAAEEPVTEEAEAEEAEAEEVAEAEEAEAEEAEEAEQMAAATEAAMTEAAPAATEEAAAEEAEEAEAAPAATEEAAAEEAEAAPAATEEAAAEEAEEEEAETAEAATAEAEEEEAETAEAATEEADEEVAKAEPEEEAEAQAAPAALKKAADCPADPIPFTGKSIPTYGFVSMAKGGREVTFQITRPRVFNLDHLAIVEGQPEPGYDRFVSGDDEKGIGALMDEFAGFLAQGDNLQFRDANGIFVGVKRVRVTKVEPAPGADTSGGCIQGAVMSAAAVDEGSCVTVKTQTIVSYPSTEFFAPDVVATLVAELDYPLSARPSHVALAYPGLFAPKDGFAGQPIGLALLSEEGKRSGRKTNVCSGSDISPTVRAVLEDAN